MVEPADQRPAPFRQAFVAAVPAGRHEVIAQQLYAQLAHVFQHPTVLLYVPLPARQAQLDGDHVDLVAFQTDDLEAVLGIDFLRASERFQVIDREHSGQFGREFDDDIRNAHLLDELPFFVGSVAEEEVG